MALGIGAVAKARAETLESDGITTAVIKKRLANALNKHNKQIRKAA